jgi:hypothetical protein
MKTILCLAISLIFSAEIMAQSSLIQPDVFRLATVDSYNCPIEDLGKIFYNTFDNRLTYCAGIQITSATFQRWQGTSDIYYTGKVGLSNGLPSYDLDVNGKFRSNTLLINGKLGIKTDTPSEKVELKDSEIAMRSVADSKLWKFSYGEAGNVFQVTESGFSPRVSVANGGNIGIGTSANTNKLNVSGTVSYAGNVLVGGQGLMQNTSATQLKMYIGSFDISSGANPVGSNSCQTIGFNFNISGIFTAPPSIALGQKTAGNTFDEKLIMSVESVTIGGGTVRFCNNTASTLTISSHSYSFVAIGQ